MAIVGLTFFWERLEKFHELESARVSDFRPTKSLNLSRILCSISGWYSTVNLSYCRKTRKQPDLHLDEPDWWGFANSNSESLALVAGLYTQQEKSQRSESKCFKALWNPLVFTTKNGVLLQIVWLPVSACSCSSASLDRTFLVWLEEVAKIATAALPKLRDFDHQGIRHTGSVLPCAHWSWMKLNGREMENPF